MDETLVFATANAHKSEEVNDMLQGFKILNLNDINFKQDIDEYGLTFHENAEIKVDAVAKHYDGNIFADDSGLVIPALNGEPGIYSARYAGTGLHADNIEKVLQKLGERSEREAYFLAVICLLYRGKKTIFEGKVPGKILFEQKGEGGFGYDPIFQPDGYDISFAEMKPELKNSMSHRGLAISKMKSFLIQQMSL